MNTLQVERERKMQHDALADLYRAMTGKQESGLSLWRKLRRIEGRASIKSVAHCNGEIDGEQWDAEKESIRESVKRVFGGELPKGFFVNSDPRGYTLKLEENSVPFKLHEDWGRYQILAPEINS